MQRRCRGYAARGVHRRHARGAGRVGWSEAQGAVGAGGGTAQALLEPGVSDLAAQVAWQEERWVYLWADGIYSGLRADDETNDCALVVIGVNERGQRRFLAIEDGMRESKHELERICCAI